jgi:hypothetical protein
MTENTQSKKQNRRKFGNAGGPLPCTRLLVRELDHVFVPGQVAHACLAVNDSEGTVVSFNAYGAADDRFLGKGYDLETMTYELPAPGDEKWKKWKKKGYEFVQDDAFLDGLVTLKLKAEPVKAK